MPYDKRAIADVSATGCRNEQSRKWEKMNDCKEKNEKDWEKEKESARERKRGMEKRKSKQMKRPSNSQNSAELNELRQKNQFVS